MKTISIELTESEMAYLDAIELTTDAYGDECVDVYDYHIADSMCTKGYFWKEGAQGPYYLTNLGKNILEKHLENTCEVAVKSEFVVELESKDDWVNKIPRWLPEKKEAESFLFIDKNGNIAAMGKDFMVAEDKATYPIKVYKPIRVAFAHLEEKGVNP